MNFKNFSELWRVIFIIFFLSIFMIVHCSEEQEPNIIKYSMLSILWLPSACQKYNMECNTPMWSIHGMTTKLRNINRKRLQEYEKYGFVADAILKNNTLHEKLKQTWISVKPGMANMELWAYQWLNHGKYFRNIPEMSGQTAFFSKTMKLFDDLKTAQLSSELKISEKRTITIKEVEKVLKKMYGVDATIICDKMTSNEDMLREIRFCYNNNLKLFNCSAVKSVIRQNCNKENVRFPLNSEGEKKIESILSTEQLLEITRKEEELSSNRRRQRTEEMRTRHLQFLEKQKKDATYSQQKGRETDHDRSRSGDLYRTSQIREYSRNGRQRRDREKRDRSQSPSKRSRSRSTRRGERSRRSDYRRSSSRTTRRRHSSGRQESKDRKKRGRSSSRLKTESSRSRSKRRRSRSRSKRRRSRSRSKRRRSGSRSQRRQSRGERKSRTRSRSPKAKQRSASRR